MFHRKILKEIEEWKLRHNNKVLIIEGMKKVGKTSTILEFAKDYYNHVIHLNLHQNKSMKEIFLGDYDFESIENKIKSIQEFENIPIDKNTLLFIDEVQEFPRVLLSIKNFSEACKIDVVISSCFFDENQRQLLKDNEQYIKVVKLLPLDFEEFLWAVQFPNEFITEVKNAFKNKVAIDSKIHKDLSKFFYLYLLLGGMPEVIDEYLQTKKMVYAKQIQKKIIAAYFLYITQDGPKHERQKIIEVMNSLPGQLTKNSKKFMFSKISKHARSTWYTKALTWLIDANLVNISRNLIEDENNSKSWVENIDHFRVYFADTGLLACMFDDDVISEIKKEKASNIKSALYTNLVSQMLVANKHLLFYFTRKSSINIEFVVNKEDEVVLIESRPNDNRSKSLITILAENPNLNGIKLSNENIEIKNNKLILPWYCVFLI